MCEVLRLFIKTIQLNCVKEGRAVWNKNEWQVPLENLSLHNVFHGTFVNPRLKVFFSYTGKSVKTLLSKQPNLTKCLIS